MPRRNTHGALDGAVAAAFLLLAGAGAVSGLSRPIVGGWCLVGGVVTLALFSRGRRAAGDEIELAERRAEAARAEARAAGVAAARLERLFASLDEPVLMTDLGGALALWNGAAERLSGVPAARAVGRPIEEVFTQTELVRIHAAAREGRPIREQVPVSRPEGQRVWEVSAAPIAPEGGFAGEGGLSPVLMEIRDVTDQARSLQVKADFVANASHELRTPIASLRVALDTMAGLGDDEAPMRARLMTMLSGNVARMEEMVRDLLDLSRLESPEATVRIEPTPGSELAKSLGADFAAACGQRNLRLVFDFDPALEGMRTDRKLLGLILSNLIDNASKFAFEGTEIRVVGRPIAPDNGGAPGVRLEVIDRGIGIPLNQQARIFERYYQVDQARDGGRIRRGTGLGLAIVKHAVRRLGGTIRVQSVWQQGTTMIVELPGCLGA